MVGFIGGCVVFLTNRYLFDAGSEFSTFFGLMTSIWIHANVIKYEIRIANDSKQEGEHD